MSYSPGWRCAMRPPGSPEELQRRRERALALLRQGYPPVEVAERVGVDRRSVRRWKAAVRERGAKALRAQPVPGRPRKLDAPSLKELKRDLLKGAQAAGFPTDLWTCPRIASPASAPSGKGRSEEHTSELQSRSDLVCRLLLE